MAEGKNCQNKTFNCRLPEQPKNTLTSLARTERKALVQIALLHTPHKSDNHSFISVVGKQKKKKKKKNPSAHLDLVKVVIVHTRRRIS